MADNKLHAYEAAEHDAILRLDGMIVTDSPLYRSGAHDPRELPPWFGALAARPPKRILTGDDPRLPSLHEKPTPVDYFTDRFGPYQHLLQILGGGEDSKSLRPRVAMRTSPKSHQVCPPCVPRRLEINCADAQKQVSHFC